MQVVLHVGTQAIQEHKNDMYCFEFHYLTVVPNFVPLPNYSGTILLVLEIISRSDAISHTTSYKEARFPLFHFQEGAGASNN